MFNDKDVVTHIEGIRLFNSDIGATRRFIESMNANFQKGLGILWCIQSGDLTVGMIMVHDLTEDPFYTFALLPPYRGLGLMEECIEATNRHILETYHRAPSISSSASNAPAQRLIQKLSLSQP